MVDDKYMFIENGIFYANYKSTTSEIRKALSWKEKCQF